MWPNDRLLSYLVEVMKLGFNHSSCFFLIADTCIEKTSSSRHTLTISINQNAPVIDLNLSVALLLTEQKQKLNIYGKDKNWLFRKTIGCTLKLAATELVNRNQRVIIFY